MQPIHWIPNRMPETGDRHLAVMSEAEVARARQFHRSFPMYAETPLASLSHLAKKLGVAGVYIKDESYRFGLNAFKVLGGSYAMARHIAEATGRPIEEVDYAWLTSPASREAFGQATFFTATDGNHGRGVAWAARQLGQKAVVYMPKGSQQARFENIQKEGATVTIEEVNYDACVRIADAAAKRTPGGVVVQDTAWDGYEKIPAWIMQGYGTMAQEADEQLGEKPTHVIVQAGVGSLAGAVIGYFANRYPENPPVFIVVEAEEAACLYRSAIKADGSIVFATGDMPTIMAGLCCGEPNTISFDILKNHTDVFAACPDWVAADGMRTLGAPMTGDPRVISGESGAVGLGLLRAALVRGSEAELKAALKLTPESKVLMFSTEGDTDPVTYERVCWDGAYPSEE